MYAVLYCTVRTMTELHSPKNNNIHTCDLEGIKTWSASVVAVVVSVPSSSSRISTLSPAWACMYISHCREWSSITEDTQLVIYTEDGTLIVVYSTVRACVGAAAYSPWIVQSQAMLLLGRHD